MKKQVLFSMLIVALLAVSLGAPLASAQTEPVGEPGLVIVRVDAEGPAAEAGVKRGDILLAIDGLEINQPLDWFRALRNLEAGKAVELQVLHGDDERTLPVTVAERNSRALLGLQVYLGGAEDTTESEPLLLPLMTPNVGAQVVEVVDDSPASAAGLQADDVITAVNGKTLDGEASLADLIAEYQPGDEVALTVERPGADEETLELTVTLGEHPDDAARPFLGIRYADSLQIADLDLESFQDGEALPFFERHGGQTMPFGQMMPDMTATAGAVVRTVTADSPAAEAGLEPGDVITAIDGEAIDGPQTLVDAISAREPGDTVTLTVTRAGEDEPIELEAVLAANPDDAEKAYLGVSIGATMMRLRSQQSGDQGFRLPFSLDQLPFDLDQLPFDLDQLPFDLDQLPFDLPFELPEQQPSQPQA